MEATKMDVCSGEMLREKVEISWRIENFEMMWKSEEFRDRQKLRFQAGSNIGLVSDWIGYFQEKVDTSKTPGGITITKEERRLLVGLDKVPAGVKELMASARLKINAEMDTDKREIRMGITNLVQNDGPRRQPLLWIMISEALDLPLINGCLVMELELTLMKPKDPIPRPLPQKSQQQIEALFKPKFSQKLQQDLAKLLEGSLAQTDAKIISKDELEFTVNRGILSARSLVFQTMFQTHMTEAQTGIVLIPDLSSKTIAVLLQFMYTGTLHQDWSEAQVLVELIYAANKYGLQDLIDFLDQVVGRVCSKENAGRLFSLLGKLGMKTGEREVLAFIKSHMTSFEDMASFVEEGTREPDSDKSTPQSEAPDVKREKWNALRILRNSWRTMLRSPSRKSSQKTEDKALLVQNE